MIYCVNANVLCGREEPLSVQIAQTIAQIELLGDQIDELDTAIAEAYNEIDSIIKSVLGVGNIDGAVILGVSAILTVFSPQAALLCGLRSSRPAVGQYSSTTFSYVQARIFYASLCAHKCRLAAFFT